MKILSWNIQYGKGADGRIDLPRIRDHIVALGDPDVICVQELASGFDDATGGVDQVAQLAALFAGYRCIAPPSFEWWDGDRCRRFGNAVLTRLPLLEWQAHPLPRPADSTVSHMQRVLIEVVVQSPAGPLRIGTTHLEYMSLRQRVAQAQRLRELGAQWEASRRAPPRPGNPRGVFAARPVPVGSVICGDFNFAVDEPTWQAIQAPLDEGQWHDAWSIVEPGEPHLPTCGVFDRRQWPQGPHARDFFFVSTTLRPAIRALQTDVATDLSDHQPLMLVLDVGQADQK